MKNNWDADEKSHVLDRLEKEAKKKFEKELEEFSKTGKLPNSWKKQPWDA